MECLNCGYDGPPGMQFCGMCGMRMARACPVCSFSNPPDFFFCGQCGAKLHFMGMPPAYLVNMSAGDDGKRSPISSRVSYIGREDLNQVLHIMKVNKIAEGFDLVPIQKKTENEVAQILRDSLIFLSFGKAEGFPCPVAAWLCHHPW